MKAEAYRSMKESSESHRTDFLQSCQRKAFSTNGQRKVFSANGAGTSGEPYAKRKECRP